MNILILEDEKKLNQMLADYLSALGYKIKQEYNGIDGLKLLQTSEIDLALLDLMLPGMDGLDILRKVRETSSVPVIMLTARSTEQDILMGLELGADDYVTKPFSMKELAARIRAVSRRTQQSAEVETVSSGIFTVNTKRREILKEQEIISLTTVQFDILEKMIRDPGRVFTRVQLLQAFQETVFEGYERTIDVHIKNIRKIIEKEPAHPEFITTVRGIGYKLTGEAI